MFTWPSKIIVINELNKISESMKTLKTLFLSVALIACYTLTAQVAITTDGSSADGSAMLDVKSTDKGMLVPRVALTGTTDVTTIGSPATSLLVYNTATAGDVTPGFYYWNGTAWTPMAGSSGDSHYVGEHYGGGIIFWLDATGQHGLIAATADHSTAIQWDNGTDRDTGATGDGLYSGAMNTAMIIATQIADDPGGYFAAKVCADYSVTDGGVTYGDWYLPSKYELNLLYLQKAAVGGFASAYYWSSTEGNIYYAWVQYFDDGYQHYYFSKYYTGRVRAVRAF